MDITIVYTLLCQITKTCSLQTPHLENYKTQIIPNLVTTLGDLVVGCDTQVVIGENYLCKLPF